MCLVSKVNWQPSATLDTLKKRAELLHNIRSFFYKHRVLEVETPLLCQYGVSDLHLDNFTTKYKPTQQTYYLQTSPEYAMKRLLACGSGDIYQICKAFRQGEQGHLHNPEFTMLEWYRVGYNHHQLMDEIDQLLQFTIHSKPSTRMSYQQCFFEQLGIDVLSMSLTQLKNVISQNNINIDNQTLDYNTCCDLLMSHIIEPKLGHDAPIFIYDYPSSQAALAKIRRDNPPVAERFELYIKGIELANGFHELTDAAEQQQRFVQDNQHRQQHGLAKADIDPRLLAALKHGMVDCAGVALGIDRLLMASLAVNHINKAIAFDWAHA